MLRGVLLLIALGSSALLGFGYYVSQPVFDAVRGDFRPRIAPVEQALTFARTVDGVWLISAHEGDALRGLNLSERLALSSDTRLPELLGAVTLDELASWLLVADPADFVRLPLDTLDMPVMFSAPAVAAGTNFSEHADEVYSDDPPFLFPKLSVATAWDAAVPFLPRLDFEAEVCAFPLHDVREDRPAAIYGLVLCNDFTDRLTLMRELTLGEPLGQTGFAAGKGCAGCLPTGYLAVIPRSADFYRSLEVSLYVNDQKRQGFGMSTIILPLESIVAQALAQADRPYQYGDREIPLLPEGFIPGSSLILTGTGAGVLFKPANIWGQSFYLQPGDVVRTEATFLGHLENTIR